VNVNVEAVVLAAEDLSETDRRLTLYTRERGRLYARAAGARRAGARLAAATEPGARARFRLWLPPGAASGRVTGGALSAGLPGRGDWARSTTALFLCEVIDRLTPLLQPDADKHALLCRSLDAVGRGAPAATAAFLVQVARLAGYARPPGGATADLCRRLDGWDFDPAGDADDGPDNLARVEEQVVQWLAPFFGRPLKTWGHRRALERFQLKSKGFRRVP
jgi:hypothetical protein